MLFIRLSWRGGGRISVFHIIRTACELVIFAAVGVKNKDELFGGVAYK